ncbi:MAG TPA: hypothetical protein VF838_04195 [Trebonia sp.]
MPARRGRRPAHARRALPGPWERDVEQLRAQFEATLSARQRKRLDKGRAKAMTRDNRQAFGKLTCVAEGRVRLLPDPPVLVPVDELDLGDKDRAAIEAWPAADAGDERPVPRLAAHRRGAAR